MTDLANDHEWRFNVLGKMLVRRLLRDGLGEIYWLIFLWLTEKFYPSLTSCDSKYTILFHDVFMQQKILDVLARISLSLSY